MACYWLIIQKFIFSKWFLSLQYKSIPFTCLYQCYLACTSHLSDWFTFLDRLYTSKYGSHNDTLPTQAAFKQFQMSCLAESTCFKAHLNIFFLNAGGPLHPPPFTCKVVQNFPPQPLWWCISASFMHFSFNFKLHFTVWSTCGNGHITIPTKTTLFNFFNFKSYLEIADHSQILSCFPSSETFFLSHQV